MSLPKTKATYRILDACLNRAAEGFRTLEEYARFVQEDPSLAAELKGLRHALTEAAQRLSRHELLAARDAAGDVGAEISVENESLRSSVLDVVQAASARVQQSLRCLEEYGKIVDDRFASHVETIRYRSYDVCRRVEMSLPQDRRREAIAGASLYVLVDAGTSADRFAATIGVLIDAGVDVLQLRDSSQDDRTLYQRARLAADLTQDTSTLFIMNDRADLAVAAGADGVHVGQEELPVPEARRIVGQERLIGLSTHSVEQARQAGSVGADYIGYGPIFPGKTKQFDSYVGTKSLRDVAACTPLPVFAIGGITVERLPEVLAAGVARIAVTAAVSRANDPLQAAKQLKQMLKHS